MNKNIENIITRQFSKANYPLLINSYGRSGSTVLTKSIIKNATKDKTRLIKKTFPYSLSKSAWDIKETKLENGFIYKTHDYPPQ